MADDTHPAKPASISAVEAAPPASACSRYIRSLALAQVLSWFDAETRPETHSDGVVDLRNAVETQVLLEGRERQTWETAVASDDADVVVIDGSWPLPRHGKP